MINAFSKKNQLNTDFIRTDPFNRVMNYIHVDSDGFNIIMRFREYLLYMYVCRVRI